MCGIAGFVGTIQPTSTKQVQRMLDAMIHRGPDQHGLWASEVAGPGVVLGHRRLSIIDLSEAGRQPMVHSSTGVVLSYNGECYNYREIRAELQALGHQFRSRSDTEVILAAYVEWGERAITRFRGMFAVALWDPRDRSLLLVRDRMGIKPLYYTTNGVETWFASEVRALVAASDSCQLLDRAALASYLWHGFVPGPRTMVRGISLLPAGSTLRFRENGQIEVPKRYWQIPRSELCVDRKESVRSAREALEEAVQMRLVSDVPLGVFLSGGVDSSVIATLAQRSSSSPIQTFNISFEDSDFDESVHAETVARSLGTDHHRIPLDESSFSEQLPNALQSLDQPTFDGINTYFVSQAVRQAGLTVALSGAGGDELFGGYASFTDLPRMRLWSQSSRFVPERLRGFAADRISRMLAGAGSEIPPQTRWGKLRDVLDSRGEPVALYQCAYALFTRRLQNDLLLGSDDSNSWGLSSNRYVQLSDAISGEESLSAISFLELSSFIGERLLRDTDTASMAVSLEARVPLLDHKFVEAVARLPVSERYEPVGSKRFLREVMHGWIPAGVFDRPKAGFVMPLELWCKRLLMPEMDATFRDLNLAHAIGLNAEAVSRVWRAFRKGGAGLYWSRVWALFVLMRWCREHRVYL